MALKELQRPIKPMQEEKVQQFISQGGAVATSPMEQLVDGDHRLTLRIPKALLEKIDVKRKERIGSISRNLWILEQLEKSCKK